jgi:transposase-like protein
MNCPFCKSTALIELRESDYPFLQYLRCNDCHRFFTKDLQRAKLDLTDPKVRVSLIEKNNSINGIVYDVPNN